MLKGVIVGFGEVARHGHWPGYRANRDVEIVGIVDRSAERRALARTLLPDAIVSETIADLPQGIDFADICTPPALHQEPMFEALARGWHVLCEKPFLLDPAMVEAARERAVRSGVALLPVHNWKYAPIVRAATAALQSGAIGRLTHVEIETSRLQAAATAQSNEPNWRCDPSIAGGGILMDHGWHSIYLALHWFGEPVTGVRASLHRPAGRPDDRVAPAEDEANVTLVFRGGEAAIVLTWNGRTRRNAMRLGGERGEIVLADDTLHVPGREPVTFPSALSAGSHHADWFEAMLPDIVACFREPERSRPFLDEAAETLRVIQQGYRSDLSLAASHL